MANEWNKTAFVEFEAMLRRRLRNGAAPVTPCAGFDLDAASAYLEDALGGSHRAGYESHLSGCAACRRHLIELSRLAQNMPQAEARPVMVADQTPAWLRWREVVTGWFNLSTWNFKWQITGATGAAFAIMIAVLGVQSWRQSPDQLAIAFKTSATPAPAADAGFYPAQSPHPEASPQVAINSVSEILDANNPGQSRSFVPAPSVEPKGEELVAVVKPSEKAMTLPENQSGQAPNVAIPGGVVAVQNPPSQPRNLLELSASSDPSGSGLIINDSNAQEANDTVRGLRIIPKPEINPMNPGQPEENHQTRVFENRVAAIEGFDSRESIPRRPQTKPRPEPLKLSGIASSLISRIKWNSKSESVRNDDAEASENESPKPMLIPIRDKVFRFEKGMLIDREYNPVMQKWRVWTLKSGSEAYKQVLANEPLLKEYFDRGPILIVWKNRIYKVLK